MRRFSYGFRYPVCSGFVGLPGPLNQFRTSVLNGFTIKPPHLFHDSPSSSISVTTPSRSSPPRNPPRKLWNRPAQLHRMVVFFVAGGIEPHRHN
ncbi:hypothetical protein DY000_02005070 [Brassica cretica]|uniref:Uncharacterized protein n=1 Tax=Brassica cretica TaxID=69181 RepID=A0ABQ7CDY0_BRACR|nr:hypothetical protein DY000_02005070 [Brassica cretica]